MNPMATPEKPADNGLLLTIPILERMRAIEGWLEDAEADLLIATARKALAEVPHTCTIVEVGSYCGRSTVVLGSVLKALCLEHGAKLYAIDPHNGMIGALDRGIQTVEPTFEKFKHNIAAAGLAECVISIRKCSFEVEWNKPICYLFIDALHDYASVARDFDHFERWLGPGGYLAFHDYADYYPGVKTFANEVIDKGQYEKLHCAGSMIVLRKKNRAPLASTTEITREFGPIVKMRDAVLMASNPPVTVCVLTYGDYFPLVKTTIESILTNCERPLYRLVVGANAAGVETRRFLEDLASQSIIDRLCLSEANINKCPMMRRMFAEIDTEFIWWFDDDSYVLDRDALCARLDFARTDPSGAAIWGHQFFFGHERDFSYGRDVIGFVKAAPWYCGKEPPSWLPGGKGEFNFEGRGTGDGRWFFVT